MSEGKIEFIRKGDIATATPQDLAALVARLQAAKIPHNPDTMPRTSGVPEVSVVGGANIAALTELDGVTVKNKTFASEQSAPRQDILREGSRLDPAAVAASKNDARDPSLF